MIKKDVLTRETFKIISQAFIFQKIGCLTLWLNMCSFNKGLTQFQMSSNMKLKARHFTSNSISCTGRLVMLVGRWEFRLLGPLGAWGPPPRIRRHLGGPRCWTGNMEASAELQWWGRPQGIRRRKRSEGPHRLGFWWNRGKERRERVYGFSVFLIQG